MDELSLYRRRPKYIVKLSLVTSLLQSLKKIGEPKLGKEVQLPHGFHSCPMSLKKAIDAMNAPLIDQWVQSYEHVFENEKWTEECQGITSDGKCWFLISNYNEVRALYKFSLEFRLLKGVGPGEGGTGDWDHRAFEGDLHLGAPNYCNGKIYVPLEPSASVWILDINLNTLDVRPLQGTFDPKEKIQGNSMPWCAINPWNNLLYSSKFGNPPYWDEYSFSMVDYDPVTEVHCYDLKNFDLKGTLLLQGDPIHKIQGGCFSENGHLYLASDHTQQIRAYSSLNGTYLGYKWVDYDKSSMMEQEMEGIFVGSIEGDSTYVHVVVLENEWPSKDDIYFKHYSVPEPDLV